MPLYISKHPLVLYKITQLRDRDTSVKKFRELVSELAVLLAYEATQDLALAPMQVMTPLAPAQGWDLRDKIGLMPILRAGLGMARGIQDMMPDAQVWHLGLYRDEETLAPVHYYNKLPVSPTVKVCLVLDPMLATGGSAVDAVNVLKKWGAERIKLVGLIAAPEGVRRLSEVHSDVPIHVAVVDERLTREGDQFPPGYILPGLGDAGDRQFGTG